MKLYNEVWDWVLLGLKLTGVVILLIYMKRVFLILKEIFFGKEGYDYREFTGAVAMGGFIGMLIKHFTDDTYEADMYLLIACLLIIFVLAGIKEGTALINKFIGAKYNNGNNENINVD